MIEWLAQRVWERVTEARADEFGAAFPDSSARSRRETLRESGIPLDPVVEGARQDSYEHLARTLTALTAEYGVAADIPRKRLIRSIVLEAKEHATLAAKNPKTHPEKRAEKTEMVSWLLTWLENPPLFPDWVELRMRRFGLNERTEE
jgi:hypothetical protein